MAKVIHYRNKCIGCGICYEMQPDQWRMSQRDGKATLVNAEAKKSVYIKVIAASLTEATEAVARACPVKVIQVN